MIMLFRFDILLFSCGKYYPTVFLLLIVLIWRTAETYYFGIKVYKIVKLHKL